MLNIFHFMIFEQHKCNYSNKTFYTLHKSIYVMVFYQLRRIKVVSSFIIIRPVTLIVGLIKLVRLISIIKLVKLINLVNLFVLAAVR
mgnify:CR=1 FL=1